MSGNEVGKSFEFQRNEERSEQFMVLHKELGGHAVT
jgi:hypothetical protein